MKLHYKKNLDEALKSYELAVKGGNQFAQQFGIDFIENFKLAKLHQVVLSKDQYNQYYDIMLKDAATTA